MKKLILASASPRRKELLSMIRANFTCQPSSREEVITKNKPGDVVLELAYQKAVDVAASQDDESVTIAADTIVVYKNEIMGKPTDEEDAFRMLKLLQGSKHYVYTGLVILVKEKGKNKIKDFAQKTSVYMWPMSDKEIKEYISTGEPMDKAGAYGIQGKAGLYIKKINGDYNNVVGLPLSRLYKELKSLDLI